MKRIVPLELQKNLMRIVHVRPETDQSRAIRADFSFDFSHYQKDNVVLAEAERQKAEAQAAAYRRPVL
jgi:hypothetical protein